MKYITPVRVVFSVAMARVRLLHLTMVRARLALYQRLVFAKV